MSQSVERESMEVDVLYVGAGPGTLASALQLMRQVEAYNAAAEQDGKDPIEPPSVLVLEKSANVGDHMLSGAVMNPRAIRELVPDFEQQGFPTEHVCDSDWLYLFTKRRAFPVPGFAVPHFHKKGYHVISLNQTVKWLAERCEAAGIEIYPGFAADELLLDGQRVVGVRTGDMGLDKNGRPKANFQPGMDIYAKVTVLGEGVRGSLAKQLIERFDLQGDNPQTYETGIKEIWRVRPEKHKPGRVIHGMAVGDIARHKFVGMWLYDLKDNLVSYGYVTGLDGEDPYTDPHLEAQKFKTHPWMRALLEGAELVRYGAKCIPTGGLYGQPKLYADGVLLIGDAASMCNAARLSGVHMAMKTGMMAAETIVEAIAAKDFGPVTLGGYAERYRRSWAFQEHWKDRNFHGSWEKGVLFFLHNVPAALVTNGRGLVDGLGFDAGHTHMQRLSELPEEERRKETFEFDGKLTFSKEHLVQFSGTQHEVDQPSHLVVADTDLCSDQCTEEYGNPCQSFCPAAVYEMVPDPAKAGRKKLFIHHENCVHCKTCDIADPYQVITWTTPQGGEGPDYQGM
jgi:electron-transferring-flavoprotein dehydrogenase